jgi:hypothetical protein
MSDSNSIIEQYYAKVPKQFRALIESKDFEEDLLSIGRSHGLHIDELEVLMLEVKFFILGISDPDTLKDNLKSDLSLSPENVDVLINELNATLFVPLRELLKGMSEHEKEQEQMKEEQPAPTQSVTPQPVPTYKQVLTSKKLNEVVRVPHQITDYSVGRGTEASTKEEINKAPGKYDSMDPYHEIIE